MTLQLNGDLVWVHVMANCVPQDVKKTYRLVRNIVQWLTFEKAILKVELKIRVKTICDLHIMLKFIDRYRS
jgi:hypothetical protein